MGRYHKCYKIIPLGSPRSCTPLTKDILGVVREIETKAKKTVDDGTSQAREIVAATEKESTQILEKAKRDAEKEARKLLSTLKEDALAKQKVALSKGKTAVKALQKKASVRIDAVAKEIAEGILDTEERRF